VQLLLGRGDVNPDKSDKDYLSPLGYAAQNGHEGVVQLLLGREDVNPDKPDGFGRTPIAYAAKHGTRKWCSCYLSGGVSTPTRQTVWPQHRSFMLLPMCTRE